MGVKFSPADALRVAKLKRLGILMPLRMLLAARDAKLPLAAAAACLIKETGGGRNVFGSDPTIFAGAGEVTEAKYRAYLAQRGPKGRGGMQGVGPTQLTWYSFQDEADRLGGCWRPDVNMRVGFTLLADHIRRLGLEQGFAAYNGSGEAAERYGRDALEHYRRFDAALREKPPAPAVGKPLLPAHSWKQFVYGDIDVERPLLVALAEVAREIGPAFKVFVRSGKRSRAEQQVLYAKYLRYGQPPTARPGTSRHETGRAADCQLVFPNGAQQNIGTGPGARAALKRHGLCLPVPGETWHVERGTTWNA